MMITLRCYYVPDDSYESMGYYYVHWGEHFNIIDYLEAMHRAYLPRRYRTALVDQKLAVMKPGQKLVVYEGD